MAVQTIVLYAPRLYSGETYSTNQDPESLSVSLSDSASLTDAGITDAINKALADAITLTDARITAVGTKPLSDSATLTETIAKALTHALSAESITLSDTQTNQPNKALTDPVSLTETVISFLAIKALTEGLTMTEQRIFSAAFTLADNLLVEDTSVRLTQIKGLSEFIFLKDWLELRLQRANVWQATAAYGFRPSQIHLYGPGVYYGFDFYGSNPSVNWLLETPNTTTWQTPTQTMGNEPLYAATTYGQSPFGSVPAVGWTNPISAARQSWTNANGESHN